VLEGAPAEPGTRFALWGSRDAAATATTGPRLPYLVVFAEPVGDLAPGAPVTLAGKQIGRVAGTTLEVAPDGSGLITPATIAIDARSMAMEDLDTLTSRETLRERLNAIIGRLVGVGMRARIAEGGIVFGARSIELIIDPDAAPARFSPDTPVPVIPAAVAGSGQAGARDDGTSAPGQENDAPGEMPADRSSEASPGPSSGAAETEAAEPDPAE